MIILTCPNCYHAWYEDEQLPDSECSNCGTLVAVSSAVEPIADEDDDWENPWDG